MRDPRSTPSPASRFQPAESRSILVFGLSGQVGRALLRQLPDAGALGFDAVSRWPRSDARSVQWLRGSLEQPPALNGDHGLVLSLGPLDAFARWFAASGYQPARIIALGSTSVHSRRDSPDPMERALALRLLQAEQGLAEACEARGTTLQLLRPTLLWGDGRDDSLSRLAARARRIGVVILPGHARGLRQPVHVDDLAAAIAALIGAHRSAGDAAMGRESPLTVACDAANPAGFAFDLPGGEALAWDEMLRRCLAVAAPKTKVLRFPAGPSRLAVRGLLAMGRWSQGHGGRMARVAQDQVFDPAPAMATLGWQPRGFSPRPGDFPG